MTHWHPCLPTVASGTKPSPRWPTSSPRRLPELPGRLPSSSAPPSSFPPTSSTGCNPWGSPPRSAQRSLAEASSAPSVGTHALHAACNRSRCAILAGPRAALKQPLGTGEMSRPTARRGDAHGVGPPGLRDAMNAHQETTHASLERASTACPVAPAARRPLGRSRSLGLPPQSLPSQLNRSGPTPSHPP